MWRLFRCFAGNKAGVVYVIVTGADLREAYRFFGENPLNSFVFFALCVREVREDETKKV